MGMTTTATSFARLHTDVIHYEVSGVTEISNSYRIPPIYCSGYLPQKFLVFLLVVAVNRLHLTCLLNHPFQLWVFHFQRELMGRVGEWKLEVDS